MKIVTTPMCEEIVRLAGIDDYVLNKFPESGDGDLAIVLFESKVDMDSVSIKINTSTQIFESIKKISSLTGSGLDDKEIYDFFRDYPLCRKYLHSDFTNNINVKVYSEFLKDIVYDVGFQIDDNNFSYVIYPDYMKNKVSESANLVEIPSHNEISKNPFKKAELRYSILETLI